MMCPQCGGAVLYQGFASVECDTLGCTNHRPSKPGEAASGNVFLSLHRGYPPAHECIYEGYHRGYVPCAMGRGGPVGERVVWLPCTGGAEEVVACVGIWLGSKYLGWSPLVLQRVLPGTSVVIGPGDIVVGRDVLGEIERGRGHG